MDKKSQVEQLFQEIFETNVCGYDPLKVKRDIPKTNIDAKIFVIAEAMAPSQVRLSGVNYFFKNGEIGSTGKNLERFLNTFGGTVYPNKPNCVYHTEIVHSFPGYTKEKSKRTIKSPTNSEIEKSVKTGILEREIETIRPNIIFLMGSTAYKTFYKYFLHSDPTNNLTNEISNISIKHKYKEYKEIPVIPIQHASGSNPRFYTILQNKKLINIINNILYLNYVSPGSSHPAKRDKLL